MFSETCEPISQQQDEQQTGNCKHKFETTDEFFFRDRGKVICVTLYLYRPTCSLDMAMWKNKKNQLKLGLIDKTFKVIQCKFGFYPAQ